MCAPRAEPMCAPRAKPRYTPRAKPSAVPRAEPRGAGLCTGVLVSASLDEQFMSKADVCTLLTIALNRGLSDMNELSKVLQVIYRISLLYDIEIQCISRIQELCLFIKHSK